MATLASLRQNTKSVNSRGYGEGDRGSLHFEALIRLFSDEILTPNRFL